jgi:hypothetical protein
MLRDETINKPSGVYTVNKYGEQACAVSILPDLRPPSAFLSLGDAGVDTDSSLVYADWSLEKKVSLCDYVFLIDKSGSMSG